MRLSRARIPLTTLGLAIRLGVLALPLALAGAACKGGDHGSSGNPGPDAGAPEGGVPFEPLSATASVTKVKRVLTGLPPSDAEVQAVAADPTAIRGLVQGWMKTPQYSQKMLEFFMTSFQQTQLDGGNDFTLQMGTTVIAFAGYAKYAAQFQQNLRESFARTVMQLISEGASFQEVLTTKRFMLTPALAIYYAYADDLMLPDAQSPFPDSTSQIMTANPAFQFWVTSTGAPFAGPLMTNPGGPTFWNPDLPLITAQASPNPAVDTPLCQADPRVYDLAAIQTAPWYIPWSLFDLIFSELPQVDLADHSQCYNLNAEHANPQLVDSDVTTWTMTTIRQPAAGEATTLFYDLGTIRSANELVLRTPRVGFFTTPSFLAQWPTNNDNKDRVIINQTLIGAVGQVFQLNPGYVPVLPNGQDAAHAAPGSGCAACHATMDPMAQFFRQAYTLSYTNQDTSLGDPSQVSTPGVFAFGGETAAATNGIYDLGAKLAASPEFPIGWTQKLCYAANASPCTLTDPEFLRVVSVFQKSGFSWPALVLELFSSPLVTELTPTVTATTVGVTTAVDRQNEFCDLLSFRLGIDNICGLGPIPALTPTPVIATIATALPADGYARGVVSPFLSNAPTLFFRAGVEELCINVAGSVIDAGANSKYLSTAPDAAITDFVQTLMGLPSSDERYAPILAILNEHFTSAMAPSDGGAGDAGAVMPASASDALKSTFVLACTSPLTVAVGL